MKRLEGRVAVVTGAASGLGRATSLALARSGCRLVLVDVDGEGLEDTRRSLQGTGDASTHVVDVSKVDAMRSLVRDTLEAHGRVEVLVNIAGVSLTGTFQEQSLDDIRWLFETNVWGVVHGCKLFLPHLLEADEAHIVNMSSMLGLVGVPLNSTYCASKSAVLGLSESMRIELADTSVGVTCAIPGGVATNIVANSRCPEGTLSARARARAIELFRDKFPPGRAAEQIVSAIRRNASRVLITREAHALDALQRLSPRFTSALVRRNWRRIMDDLRDAPG